MYNYARQTIIIVLSVTLLLAMAFTPTALAWEPSGKMNWSAGPNGCWYKGNAWWLPGSSFSPPHCEPGNCGHGAYYDPNYGYYEYWCPAPQPAPQHPIAHPVQVTPSRAAVTYPQEMLSASMSPDCDMPQVIPFRYDMSWGTFVTYDNWASAFYRYHEHCPGEQDIWDYWYSQDYAARHGGRSPW